MKSHKSCKRKNRKPARRKAGPGKAGPGDLDGEILRAGSALLHRVPGRFRSLKTGALQDHLRDADALLENQVVKVLVFEHLRLVVMTSETAARLTHAWVNKERG